MVNVELGERLAEAGAAVLAILDPEQLPPVKGGAYFSGVPDVMLRQIHRQALNSPIITLSMSIREGAIPTARKIDWDLIEQGDVVLCAFNRTRRALNVEIRRRRHYRGLYPEDGECVVCLRNDYSRGVLNGVTYTVVGTRTIGVGGDNLKMIVRDDDGAEFEAVVPKECFASDIDPHTVRPELNPFDFGYCITCHKSQGSEWGRVVVIDESAEYARCAVGNTPGDWARKQMSKRWLYTAITRASERVDIMRSE